MTATIASNEQCLRSEGVYIDHLDKNELIALNNLPPEEVQLLADLRRRFTGDIPAEPAMYEGSDHF